MTAHSVHSMEAKQRLIMLFLKKSIKRGSPLAQFTFGCIYKFITKFTFFNSFPKNFILLCFNLDFELNSSILYDRKKDLKSGFFTLISHKPSMPNLPKSEFG